MLKFLGKRRIFEKRWLRKGVGCFFFDFADGSELGMLAAVTMRLREAWRLREWWRQERHRLKWERERERERGESVLLKFKFGIC